MTASTSKEPVVEQDKQPSGTGGLWRLTMLFTLIAFASTISLTGTSVWLLGSVALAGSAGAAYSFNFHIPAALIRLFAILRTTTKYGERVSGHKAALLDQVERRTSLFAGMAFSPAVRRLGWQLGDQDKLADFIDDVEDLDYARLRINLPFTVMIVGFIALCVITAFIAPAALLAIIPIAATALFYAFALLPHSAAIWHLSRKLHRRAGRELGACLGSIAALRAEGVWGAVLGDASIDLVASEQQMLNLRRQLAVLDLMTGALGPLAAFSVLASAWFDGLRAESLLPAAFTAFLWIAAGEALQSGSRILLARIRKEAASEELQDWPAEALDYEEPPSAAGKAISEIEVNDLPLCAPNGRRLGKRLTFGARTGRPIVITGASGCGKTSLLKQLSGWFETEGNDRILIDGQPLSGKERRALVHFSLHDAAILSDTVRENLFAPSASDSECWEVLQKVELDERIKDAGGLDAWIQQDMLSLGEAQRLNLARAFLARRPIIVMDEPCEHLDQDQVERIIGRIIQHFDRQILIFSSHQLLSKDHAVRTIRL